MKVAEIANNAGTKHIHRININVDRQSGNKAIISHRITSEHVLRSKQVVAIVAVRKRLHKYWVSGHKDIPGNEIANEIAKSAIRPNQKHTDLYT